MFLTKIRYGRLRYPEFESTSGQLTRHESPSVSNRQLSALGGEPWSDMRSNTNHRRGYLARLRERKLVEWMLAYVALAWVALQMTDALREIWNWPGWLQRSITLGLGLGIMPACVVAWYHGERGHQRVCACEVLVVGALFAASAWLIWRICF